MRIDYAEIMEGLFLLLAKVMWPLGAREAPKRIEEAPRYLNICIKIFDIRIRILEIL